MDIENFKIFLNIFQKFGKNFQKIFQKIFKNFLKIVLNLVKLLKTSKKFITNFTDLLEILRNLQNKDMKN